MEYEQFFSHIRICSILHCYNVKCDTSFCEEHGGVRHQCNSIKRNGLRCTNRCNDSGEKCGIHGGLSKTVISEISRFLRLTTLDGDRPQFHVVLSFVRYRLAVYNQTSIESNYEEHIDVSGLVSSFTKVSISGDCAICLSELVDGVEHPCCKKASCVECMKKWMTCSSNCPYCRAKLR